MFRRDKDARRVAKSVRTHEKTMAALGEAAGGWTRDPSGRTASHGTHQFENASGPHKPVFLAPMHTPGSKVNKFPTRAELEAKKAKMSKRELKSMKKRSADRKPSILDLQPWKMEDDRKGYE